MKILLLSCGGTIVSKVAGSPDTAAATAVENAAELLVRSMMTNDFKDALNKRGKRIVDNLKKQERSLSSPFVDNDPVPTIECLDLMDKDSTEMGPSDWTLISKTLLDKYSEYDAFIITHGTNSLAYTASALTFALPQLGKPVVMTGSNIPIGPPYSDALVNGANAVLLAQKLVFEQIAGVMVVFASRIIPGIRAKKASGTEMEAFRTFNASDIGQVRPKEVVFHESEHIKYVPSQIVGSPFKNYPPTRDAIVLRQTSQLNFDAVISSHTFHPGDDPETYKAVLEKFHNIHRAQNGLRGAMIIRAVGDGDISKKLQEEVLTRARDEEVPVVITTQEPQGTSTFLGNQQSEGVDAIPAWDMSIETMVVKLRHLLAKGTKYAEMCQEFTQNCFGEINVRHR